MLEIINELKPDKNICNTEERSLPVEPPAASVGVGARTARRRLVVGDIPRGELAEVV